MLGWQRPRFTRIDKFHLRLKAISRKQNSLLLRIEAFNVLAVRINNRLECAGFVGVPVAVTLGLCVGGCREGKGTNQDSPSYFHKASIEDARQLPNANDENRR